MISLLSPEIFAEKRQSMKRTCHAHKLSKSENSLPDLHYKGRIKKKISWTAVMLLHRHRELPESAAEAAQTCPGVQPPASGGT